MPLVQGNSLHNGFLAGLVGGFVGGVPVNTFTHTTCQHGHECHARGLVNGSLRKRRGTWHEMRLGDEFVSDDAHDR